MAQFLIDANLPYRFSLWQGDEFEHVYDIGDNLSDTAIWQCAQSNSLTIVTKDTDFSDWIILTDPPPRVVHLRIGNMRLRELFSFLQHTWPQVAKLSSDHKLVIVRQSLIECVA